METYGNGPDQEVPGGWIRGTSRRTGRNKRRRRELNCSSRESMNRDASDRKTYQQGRACGRTTMSSGCGDAFLSRGRRGARSEKFPQ